MSLSGRTRKGIVGGGFHMSEKQDGYQTSDVQLASHMENHPHPNCVENLSVFGVLPWGRLVFLCCTTAMISCPC